MSLKPFSKDEKGRQRYTDKYGYVKVRIQTGRKKINTRGQVKRITKLRFEHRLVIEEALDIELPSYISIHHKGIHYPIGSRKNKQDNRLINLKIYYKDDHHKKEHQLEKIGAK